MKDILKMIPILLLMILVSCKKKDPKPEAFDITKYSIVGTLSMGYPYIITIESDRAVLTHYGITNGKYTFIDGVLMLNFNDEVICSFVVENGNIKSYEGPIIINTYDLVKVPPVNQFDGRTFKGIWTLTPYQTTFKFSANQVAFTISNQTNPLDYALINNLAALEKDGNNSTLFVLVDGKLEVGRNIGPKNYWGTFMLQ